MDIFLNHTVWEKFLHSTSLYLLCILLISRILGEFGWAVVCILERCGLTKIIFSWEIWKLQLHLRNKKIQLDINYPKFDWVAMMSWPYRTWGQWLVIAGYHSRHCFWLADHEFGCGKHSNSNVQLWKPLFSQLSPSCVASHFYKMIFVCVCMLCHMYMSS